jgi:hypothetical protein
MRSRAKPGHCGDSVARDTSDDIAAADKGQMPEQAPKLTALLLASYAVDDWNACIRIYTGSNKGKRSSLMCCLKSG